jgi:hypothetical protein
MVRFYFVSEPLRLPRCRHVTIVTVEMGYGHLRAATPLADALGVPYLEMDRPPLATPNDQAAWHRSRRGYEALSRSSQLPFIGWPLRALLDAITAIPRLYPLHDLSAPTIAVRTLENMFENGLGDRLLAYLRRSGGTLLTTFFAPAIFADLAGWDRIVCVVTDSDINRVWVPRNTGRSCIHYCVPSQRARRRLQAYGVPSHRIHLTGFPLPGELLGSEGLDTLRADLAARLGRLDPAGTFRDQYRAELEHFLPTPSVPSQPGAPLVTFAVGGAGAQAHLVRPILSSLGALLHEGKLRLALVAGTREDLATRFVAWVAQKGLSSLLGDGIEIVWGHNFLDYYRLFNRVLRRTDVLWTKPSELTFYGALGLPLLLSPPVGVHERLNRRWAMQHGAGMDQGDPHAMGEWLPPLLADGTLAAAAWSGYLRLPKFGTQRILEVVQQVGDS